MRKIPKYGSQDYWKSAYTYEFETKEGSKLHVFAHSEKAAKVKGTNWGKWLTKTGRGKDKAITNTVRRIF